MGPSCDSKPYLQKPVPYLGGLSGSLVLLLLSGQLVDPIGWQMGGRKGGMGEERWRGRGGGMWEGGERRLNRPA
jgi:hypothetical protein